MYRACHVIPRMPITERLEGRQLLAASPLKVNFQPAGTSPVSGYEIDAGAVYGDRGAGHAYGWTTSHTDSAADRDVNFNQLVDTHIAVKAAARWEAAVENGAYDVKLVVGDSAAATTNNVWIEGAWILNYVGIPANSFSTASARVQVNDGRLTLGVGGSASGATRYDYLEITPAVTSPASPPPASPPPSTSPGAVSINFQPEQAAPVGGYFVDSGQTFGSRGNGQTYGWTVDHTNMTLDRENNSNQLLDTRTAVIARSQWELGLANGTYNVKVSVGDAGASSTNNIWVEGQWLVQYRSLPANTFATHSIAVQVSDGKLTLGVGGSATGETRINYVEVTPSGNNGQVDPEPTPVNFPTSISFQTVAPSPMLRAEALGAVVDGKVYVLGGFNGSRMAGTTDRWIASPRCDVYDPKTNKWTRIADMPIPFTHASGVVVGKVIWFVGGYEGNHPGPGMTTVWKYDTVANNWSRGPDLPLARGAGGAALIGNTIYYVGGMDKTRTIDKGDMWALDLGQQSAGWVQKKSLPTPRNHIGVVALNGKLWVIGGQLGQEEESIVLRALDVYDPTTNSWTKKADLPGKRSHLTASVFAYKGRLISIGGYSAHNVSHREIFNYDPGANRWSTLGLIPQARNTAVAVPLPDGRFVITTGNDPAPTDTTWIGTPK